MYYIKNAPKTEAFQNFASTHAPHSQQHRSKHTSHITQLRINNELQGLQEGASTGESP